MAGRPPSERDVPQSPDELGGGLRGPVRGVTRIGPRAFGLAFLVICVLLIAILYGLNRGPNAKQQQEAFNSPPPAPASDSPHFGEGLPIVATAAPPTPAPPVDLPTNGVPDLASSKSESQAAPPPPAPAAAPVRNTEDGAAAQRAAADEDARRREQEARDKAEAERLLAARKSAILTGGRDSNGSGGGDQLAFAGNGSPAGGASGGGGGSGGASSGGSLGGPNPGGAGAGQTSGRNASSLLGQDVAPEPAASSRAESTGYLAGPNNQYAVQGANIVLPEGGNPKDFLQAQRFAPVSPYEITAGSVLPATLIFTLDSEQPGLMSAQIREDVFDTRTGKYLLIPRGTKLVGLYRNDVTYGQSRLLVAWNRLIFPDTSSIDLLAMPGADVEGGAGLGGIVDNHYGKIFGAAILTSILAAGLQLAQPPQQQGATILQQPTAGQTVSQSVGTEVLQTGVELVRKNLNIPPTIFVTKGYPFLVVVDRDMVLPGPYHFR